MSAFAGIAFLAGLLLFVVLGVAGPPYLSALRRARLMRMPFPAAWRAVLRQRMPLYGRLPPDVQRRLRQRVQVLLAEVPFIGCGGLQITDEVRVLIAAQAALLLIGRGPAFGGLREVLVYPGHFVVRRSEPGAGGVVREGRRVLAGESWQRGQVVLAWDAVVEGAADPADGANVVLHEFAHQLDHDHHGRANGAPFLGSGTLSRRDAQQRWAEVMNAEFAALRLRLAQGEPDLIDPYAATDPAEFFAVTSELFYERPVELATAHAALYEELMRCYRVDPRHW
jgi:Mlc titration factor MtfA (ptsG expression regulator)